MLNLFLTLFESAHIGRMRRHMTDKAVNLDQHRGIIAAGRLNLITRPSTQGKQTQFSEGCCAKTTPAHVERLRSSWIRDAARSVSGSNGRARVEQVIEPNLG